MLGGGDLDGDIFNLIVDVGQSLRREHSILMNSTHSRNYTLQVGELPRRGLILD